MSKINFITPPDLLHNKATSFLLIYPSNEVKVQFQNLLAKFDIPINVYFYEPTKEDEQNIPWLINVANLVDYTILDVDNVVDVERNFVSYFISLTNTFYLTKADNVPYNLISVNRIYNLDWLYNSLQHKED
jgi:hypothetical protein